MTKKQQLKIKADVLWKHAIFNKHKPLCELCTGNWKITAHHFFFKSTYGHLRYNLDNGVVLCGKCHASLHWQVRDQKAVEYQIIGIRGKHWHTRLKKKAFKKPTSSYQTISYYENIIIKLT